METLSDYNIVLRRLWPTAQNEDELQVCFANSLLKRRNFVDGQITIADSEDSVQKFAHDTCLTGRKHVKMSTEK